MKRLISRIAAPAALSVALVSSTLFPSLAFAVDPREMGFPEKIELPQTTPLLDMNGTETGYVLTPQTVTVLESFGDNHNYIVDTWIGPMRVNDFNRKPLYPVGDFVGKTIQLTKVTPLHNGPTYKPSGYALAPQPVKIIGETGIYLIVDTWVGRMTIDKRDVQ
ncbi:hypothetical protein N6H14_16375 [Paenibacillus sp. CC-CFT747]|nr:hypothetical protein N6H14_16375 [Paenibacillus sp. CC-CFT747]